MILQNEKMRKGILLLLLAKQQTCLLSAEHRVNVVKGSRQSASGSAVEGCIPDLISHTKASVKTDRSTSTKTGRGRRKTDPLASVHPREQPSKYAEDAFMGTELYTMV